MATWALLLVSLVGSGQVRLPQIVRDSMILQRDAPVNIWGWASANEKVTVRLNGKPFKTNANASGEWKVQLPPTRAGGPYTIEVIGKNRITLKEVLFGDVWFCSGQSNMVHQLNIHDITYSDEIETADFPQIRQFLVPGNAHLQRPQTDLDAGSWVSAVGREVRSFSAVAYFFAKKIHLKYKVPVGIINASVGGTPIEAWISAEGLNGFTTLKGIIQRNKDTALLMGLGAAALEIDPPPPPDAGMVSTPKWFEPGYVPKGWRNINIPGYWEDQGIKNLNGIVWYRREIDIPATMVGKNAKVFLGRIVDADELFINGRLVGKTGYQYPQRRYQITPGILKAGKNVFAVRVTNTGGKGGFVPDKPYCVFAGSDTVDLKGYWCYKVGAVFKPNDESGAQERIMAHNQPTALYNAMVAPEINFTIRGICWYQGESNAGRPKEYEKLLKALINDWRAKWGNVELPVLVVQLPGYMDYNYLPSESDWALMREAQLNTLALPNTGLAVAIDLGEWNDIHPDNKKDVGERLAISAFKVAYHEDVVSPGPVFKEASIEGNRIFVTFSGTGSGLATNDGGPPAEFAIADEDKKFVWAKAKIEGDKVVVWSDEVPLPKYVRYAWADNPVNPNLYNREGLPASPFRSDK